MFLPINKNNRLPDSQSLILEDYQPGFTLNRLTHGVDNTHYDVHLSPDLCETTRTIITELLKQFARIRDITTQPEDLKLPQEISLFYEQCHGVLNTALDEAKRVGDEQIFLLAKVAIFKMLFKSNKQCFSEYTTSLSEKIWELESGSFTMQRRTSTIKEKKIIFQKRKLALIKKNRNQILQQIHFILVSNFNKAQNGSIEKLRRIIFGDTPKETRDLFNNIMISAGKRPDTMFMSENYILFDARRDKPDSYSELIALIKNILKEITSNNGTPLYEEYEYDGFMKNSENFDSLLNYIETQKKYNLAKKENCNKQQLKHLKKTIVQQKQLLTYFFTQFKKNGLIQQFTTFYELKPLFPNFCPPLSPRQVIQFYEIARSGRDKSGFNQRLEKRYGKEVPLAMLYQKVVITNWVGEKTHHRYLLQYIKAVSRYHRDLENFILLRRSTNRIKLLTDNKSLNLSTVNQTLYSFLLPHETVFDLGERPLINHTIVKADIRGATEIIHKMQAKDLNPASYFSLNFFEPINNILGEFGAKKIFTEGDAMILSLGEQKDTPGDWYSVARACGLSLAILQIIEQYNNKNRNVDHPPLEIGCGVCFRDGSPTYLFDGDKLILISLAINLADRMSSSTKSLAGFRKIHNRLFNLYVFQKPGDKEKFEKNADDYRLRFNVNGVELNRAGFEKLQKEIKLSQKTFKIPGTTESMVKVYIGSYPTTSGEIRQLVIHEATVMEILPDTLKLCGRTDDTYYEVLDKDSFIQRLKAKFES